MCEYGLKIPVQLNGTKVALACTANYFSSLTASELNNNTPDGYFSSNYVLNLAYISYKGGMTISMEKPKNSERNLVQCHLDHHKLNLK